MRRRPPGRRLPVDTPFFSPALPRVFAHRGLAVDAPENTLLAFLKALSIGVDYLETDVQVSRDGAAVIAHDADLSRLVGRPMRIDQLTLAELRSIDLGNGQTFSTLREVLEAFPEAHFNIDIKSDGAVDPTVRAILDTGSTHRVLIASFSDRRRKAAVTRLGAVATSASRRASIATVVAGRLGLVALVRWLLRQVDAVQLPEKVRSVRIVTPRLVRAVHRAGAEVHVWTINDVATMTRLLAMGVDGIVTDRADLAMKLVRPD